MAKTPIDYNGNGFWANQILLSFSLIIVIDSIDRFTELKEDELNIEVIKLKLIRDANYISWGGSIFILTEYLEIMDKENFNKLIEFSLDNFFNTTDLKSHLKKITLEYLEDREVREIEIRNRMVTDSIKNLVLIKLLVNDLLNIQLNTDLKFYY